MGGGGRKRSISLQFGSKTRNEFEMGFLKKRKEIACMHGKCGKIGAFYGLSTQLDLDAC